MHIANAFSNYFNPITQKIQAKIKFFKKSFMDYLYYPNEHTFLIRPTSPDEIINIITSLDSIKSTGPNSLPTKILKLLKNDITIQ